ncbi:Xanthine/uracil/vitamin C permease [Thermobaculum terrenum ATCC BAA-798]|uniref:Xanthine/uracil/vitamin C permease n=1 Tax=Thermobaculum terrenum (strain ATCC BAA-798 / CCMEE 7001 / YNP1) TaxID=525904 RepID=D1CF09_THET1|nr:NCS2 family permease [Thermobaculum terrenum]ACZ41515.1 Xanthine/uracil/vitamin C permease [Thermobaculum terrenum ATCC BAA-798]
MSKVSAETGAVPSRGLLDRVFKLSEYGTTVKTEVMAGITTFMVMSYIVFVNPSVLSLQGRGLPPAATLTATALVAGVMTILMGLYTNKAFAIASGMGLNAVVAYQLIAAMGLTPAEAMGVIVIEGLIILVLTQTNFREAIMRAIPTELKRAIAVGIGLFLAFIGLVNAGFVVPGTPDTTAVRLGDLTTFPILVFVFGMMVMIFLRSVGARIHPIVGNAYLLIGILLTTLFATIINTTFFDRSAWSVPGVAQWPSSIISAPDFSTIGNVNLTGVFNKLGTISALLVIFSIMLSDFFDTMGTLVGVGSKAGYLDDQGNFPDVKKPLLVDSLAAVVGGFANASSATTYIESAAGIEAGGRTGLTSVVTGICFLLMMFLSPLASVIPAQATAPALVLVGWMMMTTLAESEETADEVEHTASGPRSTIPFGNFEVGFPAAITMIVMPFTYSITDGIGAGIILYTLIQIFTGKARKVHPGLWIVTVAFVLYFLQGVLDKYLI